MSEVPYHAWTHRKKGRGGTDPLVFFEPSEIFHRISTVGVNNVVVRDEPGVLTGYYITNVANTFLYAKLYDDSSAPTVGTDVPVLTLGIPPLTAANIGFNNPVEFLVGIALGLTSGIEDSDSTGVSIGQMAVNLFHTRD